MRAQLQNIIDKTVYKSVRKTIFDWPLDFGVETAVMNNVKGDYHEFGVLEGRSFIRAANSFKQLLPANEANAMRFIAYDSFEGLPETNDPYAPAHFKKGAYAAAEDTFLKNVENAGINPKQVMTVPGFYDKSLTEEKAKEIFKDRKIAMTYIDCDIYESTVPIMRYITHGLQIGSVIVIDDWVRHHSHPSHGMQRAVNEWLEENPSIKLSKIALTKRVAFVVYGL